MVRRKGCRAGVRTPAFGISVLTPVLLVGAVAASPDRTMPTDVRPSGSMPVTVAASPPAPAPAAAVRAPVDEPAGVMRIPPAALSAYRKAAQTMATDAPGCGLNWNLLAGIGRIESSSANRGASAVRAVHARPTGSKKSPSANLFELTLATARQLCSSGLNLADQAQALVALLRYSQSLAFAQNVLGWASAYATGSAPLNLPSIIGPVPTLGRRLPGRTWRDLQAPLMPASSTQAGYLLPRPGPDVAGGALPAQASPAPLVIPPPVPEPAPSMPEPAPKVAPPRAAGAAASVPQQVALQRDREPKAAAQSPVAQSPAVVTGGRQAGRAQPGSQPQPTAQSPRNNDDGGGKRAGGERRGGKSAR